MSEVFGRLLRGGREQPTTGRPASVQHAQRNPLASLVSRYAAVGASHAKKAARSPRNQRERAALLAKLQDECVSMQNAISLDDFDDKDKPVGYLQNIVRFGQPVGTDQKRRCYHIDTLYNMVVEAMIRGNVPRDPLTRDPLSDRDIANVLRAKASSVGWAQDQDAMLVHVSTASRDIRLRALTRAQERVTTYKTFYVLTAWAFTIPRHNAMDEYNPMDAQSISKYEIGLIPKLATPSKRPSWTTGALINALQERAHDILAVSREGGVVLSNWVNTLIAKKTISDWVYFSEVDQEFFDDPDAYTPLCEHLLGKATR